MTEEEKEASKKAKQEKRKNEKLSYRTGEQVGYVVDNSELYTKDAQGALSPWAGANANFDRIFGILNRTIKSATDGYLGSAAKQSDGAYQTREVFVDAAKSAKVDSALDFKKNSLLSGNYNYLADSSEFVQDEKKEYEGLRTVRKITGGANKRELAQLASENAYSVKYSKDKGKSDYATIDYRFPSDMFAQYEQEHEAYLNSKKSGAAWAGSKDAKLTAEARAEKDIFGDILKGSNKSEKQLLKSQESDRVEKLEAKNEKKGKSYTLDHEQYKDKVDQSLSADEKSRQYEQLDDDKKREQQDKQKQQEEQKERKETLGRISAVAKAAVGAILLVADVCRRILTAVLDLADKVRSDGNQSRSNGVTYYESRQYNKMEEARGIPKGTTMSIVEALNQNFGSKDAINQEGLKAIALLGAPDTVAKAVHSGEAPVQDLMHQIVDAALERIASGKDWEGNNVGFDKSLVNTQILLRRIGGEGLATLVAQIAKDNRAGVDKGEFKSLQDYLTKGVITGDKTSLDFAVLDEIMQDFNKAKNGLHTEVEGFLTDLGIKFRGLLQTVKDLDIGKSASEKIEDSNDAVRRNREAKEAYTKERDSKIYQAEKAFASKGVDFGSLGLKTMYDKPIENAGDFARALSNGTFTIGQIDTKNQAQVDFVNTLADDELTYLLVAISAAQDRIDKADKQLQKVEDGHASDVKFDSTYMTNTAYGQAVQDMLKGKKTVGDAKSVKTLLNAARQRGIMQSSSMGANWWKGDNGDSSVTKEELVSMGNVYDDYAFAAPRTLEELGKYNDRVTGGQANFNNFVAEYKRILEERAKEEGIKLVYPKHINRLAIGTNGLKDIKAAEEQLKGKGLGLTDEEREELALRFGMLGGRNAQGKYVNFDDKSISTAAQKYLDAQADVGGQQAAVDLAGHETGAYDEVKAGAKDLYKRYNLPIPSSLPVHVSTSSEDNHTLNFKVNILDKQGKIIDSFEVSKDSGTVGSKGGYEHTIDLDLNAENGG